MDFRPLKHFLALSETLHFGRASELCHMSPSTLSRSIKTLEEQLGVELFERDNRSVVLTSEGKTFLAYAREALSQWETLSHNLKTEAQELKGELSVYCSVTASYSFLYDILYNFRQHHPKVEIKLHTGAPEQAIAHVVSGKEDIAIAARPSTLPANLAFQNIAVSPLLFIAPLDLDLPNTDEEWSTVPMILSEEGVARERVNQWFSSREIKPRIYAQVAGNEAIVSMVSLGFGVGVVPRIVLDNSPLADKVQILNVTPTLQPYDVGLCVLEKKLKSPLIRAFWSQSFGKKATF
ncbi:HTH-type transcriptional activator IlvY [Parendozoicomonas haliclonae]|uniref:Hydrogen peroxide-inducible genes activator n=1 Tax=Parendozoicomonas haliclonae TaxID=1960125 RepID=A0A1X7AIW5_9GAMM|nr:HTH-type transcriptional activator IlvY [Parendozoicomonas haliclonae]SMA44795.1 Hydrogen peroxide-inducible genes activator [Parendozoicomonas haliclonae]